MAGAGDFKRIRVDEGHRARAQAEYAGFATQLGGPNGWAGLAAECVIAEAICGAGQRVERPTGRFDVDLLVNEIGIEIKTRVVDRGWTTPELFEWLVVPTHAGREPVKAAAQLILFSWYSLEEPDLLWLLGYLRPEEFRARSVFYREAEPLPRGGWAPAGGAYALEVRQLRPIPFGFVTETYLA